MDRVEEPQQSTTWSFFKKNVTANGSVVIAQINFSQSPVIDTIKKLKTRRRDTRHHSKNSLPRNTKSFVFHKLHFYGWRWTRTYSSSSCVGGGLVSLDVRGNIDVGNNSINCVAVEDTLRKNASHLVIQRTKSFSAFEVKNNVTINTVNDRERTAFHRIGADRRSRTRFVNFTSPLLVDDAEVDYLNDPLIKDVLSTPDVQGNIDCPDINGRNVDDFLHSDEGDRHIVQRRVRISNDLIINNLVMENGSFNSVNIITLFDQRTVNGRKLSDFVQIAGTTDIQSITGLMDIQHVTVEISRRFDDYVLNGRNLMEYLNVTESSHFDSLSLSENNPDLSIMSSRALRKNRAQVVPSRCCPALHSLHRTNWYA
ncbi:hypothetical protein GHT06_022420 [Daphnia sinensis]|uniref:Uncharacterized protein n=1 Tax=Daphnia sinensis TaxID=1820382 RepID=A0AAD5KY28_9CRUS|nr:hypothetical protein GHT06_022420 [Daphnia sinensis]